MSFKESLIRFGCFALCYALLNAVLFLFLGSSPREVVGYILFSTLSGLPVFLITDFLLQYLVEENWLVYFSAVLMMLVSSPWVLGLWISYPGADSVWTKGFMILGDPYKIIDLYLPLVAAGTAGWFIYRRHEKADRKSRRED